MRSFHLAAGVAILCATFSTAAFAQGGLNDCTNMQEQVKTAIAGNQQSPNLQAATKEQTYGREYCTNSFYQQGVDHYRRALALLGAEPSKG